METILERVKFIIKQSGLTNRKFAFMLGVDPARFSRIIYAETAPNLDFLMKISNAFDISMDYLSFGKTKLKLIPNLQDMSISREASIDMLPKDTFATYSKWNCINEVSRNDTLIFSQSLAPKEKDIVICKQIDDSIELGRFFMNMLYFDNGEPPKQISGDVIGVLIRIIKIV